MLDFLNPLSENFILIKVWNFLSTIISYINPFDTEHFLGYKLISLLGDLLKSLFVPSEERILALTNTVTSKFSFVDSIKMAISSLQNIINNVGNVPKLEIPIGATKYNSAGSVILDFSFYAPFKNYGDIVITGFCYALFLWRMFTHLPNTIKGSSGITIISNDGKE